MKRLLTILLLSAAAALAQNTGITPGNGVFSQSVSVGSTTTTAAECPTGVTGADCFAEGSTAGTPTSGGDYIRSDSSTHGFKLSLNAGNEFFSAMNIGIPAASSITNADCVEWLKSAGVVTLGDTGSACGTGSGAVSSVSNSDGTLTISPTTGSVVASLALGHANTWTGLQTFGTEISIGGVTASGATGTGNVVFSASPTLTGTLSLANLTASGSSIILSGLTLPSSGSYCVQIGTTGALSTTGSACGSGSGAVNSVSNSDGTLTISPTTGSVVASLALGNANTWTATQTFSGIIDSGITAGTSPICPNGTSGLFTTSGCSVTGIRVVMFGCGTTVSASATDYCGIGLLSSTESIVAQPMPAAGTIGNLYCECGASPGSSKSFAMTVRVNGASPSSGPTCTLTGTGPATCSDTTHTASVTAGQTVDIQSVPSGTPTAVAPNCSVTY